jgi:hypothetical protein
VVVVVSTAVNAADQGISGKKLLLKSNPKMVLLSKDALVLPGANGSSSDPRCVADGGSGSGASVALSAGTTSATLSMPCANWSANGSGTLYKYKDSAGTPKTAKIKAGLLKVGSPGMGGFPVPNGAATVNVEVTVGTDKYCMSFTGTGDGSKFLVKDATAGSCAPPAPTCLDSGGASVGGFCWFVSGAPDESCDETCAAVGKTCDAATITYAGSGGTTSNCGAVWAALVFGVSGAVDADCTGFAAGLGCSAPGLGSADEYVRCTDAPTTCAASHFVVSRACACQ